MRLISAPSSRTVDELGRAAAGRRASGVGAVSVVVVQIAGEFASDAGAADLEEAGKDGSPAFLEDGAVKSFDVAVGLRSPGADAGVADIEGGERVGEAAAAELVAVIGEHAVEPPAGR